MDTRPLNRLKSVSLWAAVATIAAETGIRNLMMTTVITVGTPATATGFVYGIVQMRNARLEREAVDRVRFAAKLKNPDMDPVVPDVTPEDINHANEVPAANIIDLPRKIAVMIIEREQFVDLYGGSIESVAPTYQKIAKIMLDEDDRIFKRLEAEKQADALAYQDRYGTAETALRTVHLAIATLTPEKSAPLVPHY